MLGPSWWETTIKAFNSCFRVWMVRLTWTFGTSLPELSGEEQVPQSMRRSFWFQHNRTQAFFSADLMPTQPWIGRGGLVYWLARVYCLSCLHF
ncbi:hypothetical protein AVEN_251778-1 [Araneus ventricosus]|uniref:Uncharacterized protein n=1 Tax=Araneus ventricosus TaxID=182803 RepID=A0A4Y2N9Z8_ARAVE|nr:hypothetical protein AVEN_251778-1 [Araneus ventricosus]